MSQKQLWIGAGILVFVVLTAMAGPLFAIAAFAIGAALAWFHVQINSNY